jgi:Ca2+-transporting ATPase
MAVLRFIALDLGLAGGLLDGSRGIDCVARRRSPRSTSPSSSTASTPAQPPPAPSTTCAPTDGLCRAIALSALLQVAVVPLPLQHDAFLTTPLAIGDLVTCVGLASVVLWADELRKRLAR